MSKSPFRKKKGQQKQPVRFITQNSKFQTDGTFFRSGKKLENNICNVVLCYLEENMNTHQDHAVCNNPRLG